jgi:acyl-[acyl-carrier-protein]-phospholipid O-acyltransferase/long-chain-fatty-acid--[acyl-carrier-protein] ligase
MKVYDGAAFVAAKTGATVVPGAHRRRGAQLLRAAGRHLSAQAVPKVTISIQPRRTIPMPDLPSAKERRRPPAN